MVAVAGERGVLRIAGFACSPAVTRATAAAQALTVNGRPVADPVLKGAVRVAYRDVIAVGRHPMVALWLDLPADELDVNVHPAKTELRFRDVGAVRALVIGSIGRALAGGAGTSLPRAAALAASDAFATVAGALSRRSRCPAWPRRSWRSAPRRPRGMLPAAEPRDRSIRWARRWRRCWTPT